MAFTHIRKLFVSAAVWLTAATTLFAGLGNHIQICFIGRKLFRRRW
jgi:hypothetical protein